MKIGMSTWAMPWSAGIDGYPKPPRELKIVSLPAVASEAGAEALQIADNLPLHTLPERELRALAENAASRGLALEAGTRGLKPENLIRYMEIAKTINAGLVRTLPHDGGDRPDFAEALRRLNAVKRRYEDAGVLLAVENHDFYPSAWLRRLVEETASPAVGVCLDSVNNLGLGESFTEVFNNLGSLTLNFHCKDYRIARKPTMLGFDVEGAPAGRGMLDLPFLLRALRADISWIVESWLPWQGDIETTIRAEREWLTTGIRNLKALRAGDCQNTPSPL